MSVGTIITIFAVVFVVVFALLVFLRKRKAKQVGTSQKKYPVIGMWDLASTSTRVYKQSPLGQMLWFKKADESGFSKELAEAADRAYARVQNDAPAAWTKSRQPHDYMYAFVSETYPAASGQPSLKVTPVPPGLVGSVYDKGGFLLAGGATFLPPEFRPALMAIPNITDLTYIDAIQTGMEHESEHVIVFDNDPDLHTGLAWLEQHPFLPLKDGTEASLLAAPEEKGKSGGLLLIDGEVEIDGKAVRGQWLIKPVE